MVPFESMLSLMSHNTRTFIERRHSPRRTLHRLAYPGLAVLFIAMVLLVSRAFSLEPTGPRQKDAVNARMKNMAGSYVYAETPLGNVAKYIVMVQTGRCKLFNASLEAIKQAVERQTAIAYTEGKCTYKVAEGEIFFYDEAERVNIYCLFDEESDQRFVTIGYLARSISCKGLRFKFVSRPGFDPKALAVK